MKKTFLSLLTIGLLITPVIGLAATAPDTKVEEVINNIVKYAYGIFLTVAVISIIIVGFYFVTAAGDPEKVTRAKYFLLYALIGLLIVILAKGLVNLVSRIAGVEEPF